MIGDIPDSAAVCTRSRMLMQPSTYPRPTSALVTYIVAGDTIGSLFPNKGLSTFGPHLLAKHLVVSEDIFPVGGELSNHHGQVRDMPFYG